MTGASQGRLATGRPFREAATGRGRRGAGPRPAGKRGGELRHSADPLSSQPLPARVGRPARVLRHEALAPQPHTGGCHGLQFDFHRPQDDGSADELRAFNGSLDAWVPTPLQPNGKPARISAFDYYLINSGYRVGKPPPDGLRFMAGDPHCTGQLCPAIYLCQQWNRQILSKHTIPTRSDGCDTAGGQGYDMLVYSPGQCWDGKSLGMGMGASSPAAAITGAKPCHGRVIPRIAMSLNVGADGLGGYLSSDIRAGTTKSSPGSTGHFDYVFGWKRSVLTAIIKHCLNTTRFKPGQASCDELTNSAGTSIYQVGSGDKLTKCVAGPSCRRSKSSAAGTANTEVASRGATAFPIAAVDGRGALASAGRMLDAVAAFVQSISDSAGGAVRTR